MMSLKKGSRVRHLDRPEWGIGKVLSEPNQAGIRVFFSGADEDVKAFAMQYAHRLVVDASHDLDHTYLDHACLPPGNSQPNSRVPIASAKEGFLKTFPGGFHGRKFIDHERSYKERLRDLCARLLGPQEMRRLMDQGSHDVVVQHALQLIGNREMNLPHHLEKVKFRDGLRTLDPRAFAEALWRWMYSAEPLEAKLAPIARQLAVADADKWTILTAFSFFSTPDKSVYIKPENLKFAAEACRFEINYRPELNSLTLASVSTFYEFLRNKLADLEPRDMLDVQSFIWCIDPKNYGAGA